MDFTSPSAWAFWIPTAIAAYIGAYATEKGKRRATREDNGQIRDELAKNTQAVKDVEAKVSSDLWDRQWRVNQKRDVYARLIEGLGELQMAVGAHSAFMKAPKTCLAEDASRISDRIKTLLLELERSRAVARIFLSAEAVEAISEFERRMQRPPDGFNYDEVVKVIVAATGRLISAAKVEFGLA